MFCITVLCLQLPHCVTPTLDILIPYHRTILPLHHTLYRGLQRPLRIGVLGSTNGTSLQPLIEATLPHTAPSSTGTAASAGTVAGTGAGGGVGAGASGEEERTYFLSLGLGTEPPSSPSCWVCCCCSCCCCGSKKLESINGETTILAVVVVDASFSFVCSVVVGGLAGVLRIESLVQVFETSFSGWVEPCTCARSTTIISSSVVITRTEHFLICLNNIFFQGNEI